MMRILAIEASAVVASAAVVTDDSLTMEYTVNDKLTHSQTLLPMIDEMIRMTGIELGSVDAIAVSSGPGSFTGLRIGSATAKGLGLALDKPLVEVPTLEAMAYQFVGADALVVPLMDARRNQVYTGIYRFMDDLPVPLRDSCAVGVEELIADLNRFGQKAILLGDGVAAYRRLLDEGLEIPHRYAPPHMNRQRAGAVGALGLVYYRQGRV
jgi:tRNA threonylcarbamoyladenosine biosynthesis protein TsaB